jgi:hypothetical protein
VVVTAIDPNSVAASCGRSHAIVDARKEGKHTLLFRLKSNAGARFIALPLGSA